MSSGFHLLCVEGSASRESRGGSGFHPHPVRLSLTTSLAVYSAQFFRHLAGDRIERQIGIVSLFTADELDQRRDSADGDSVFQMVADGSNGALVL